ncbi:MAG: Rpn family recombination-promoting nuclease/putative transposase [Lachnospiraceae bacterium]|nr:Rpn family recombination-promoting nuclease/putative transposase [Lachnospiraceae bacterium]
MNKKTAIDANALRILSDKRMLAMILHRFVPEYKNCSLEDIQNKYIQDVSVANIAVGKNLTNQKFKTHIESVGVADKSENEGNVFYDIRFYAILPPEFNTEDNKIKIKMIINLEAQANYYPGYPIEKRGIYYAARNISSQFERITKNQNYSDIKKCYSIWLCMGNVPDKEAGTVTLYSMEKKDIIGSVDREKSVYDLIDVILIRINNKVKPEDELLKILTDVFSTETSKEEKQRALRHVGFFNEYEEVNAMCNYSDFIESDALSRGRAEGRAEGIGIGEDKGRKEGIGIGEDKGRFETFKMLMEYNNLSFETAANMLKLSEEDRKKYKEKLSQ